MPRSWAQHVQSPQTEAELEALRRSVGARRAVWRGVVAGTNGEATGAAIDLACAWSALEITA